MVNKKRNKIKSILIISAIILTVVLMSFILASELNENWIKVKDLNVGDEIAVFDNESGEIVFERIKSIEVTDETILNQDV